MTMLANVLAKQTTTAAGRLLVNGGSQQPKLPQTYQQVRYRMRRHTFQYAFGLPPLHTADQYDEASNSGQLEELQYKEIRPARIWETNSPFFDGTRDKFMRFMMHDGRRALVTDLLHKTFYEIKTIQYKRWKKLEQKQQQQQKGESSTDAAATAKKPSSSSATTTDAGDDEDTVETNPLVLFHQAIENCKPMVITQKVRRGGAIYQVPYPLQASRSEWYAMRWLNDTIKERPKPRKTHYHEEMAREIIDAAHGRGKVVKKKDDIHKLAQANKAYAHYRWG